MAVSASTRRKVRTMLSNVPWLFNLARGSVRFGRESIALGKLTYGHLASAISGSSEWQSVLPVQRPSKVSVQGADIIAWCRSQDLAQGHDAWYLSPSQWEASPLGFFRSRYPSNAGIKVAKNEAGVEGAYMVASAGRAMAQKRAHNHLHQSVAWNFFHLNGVAPRLYDLLEINGRTAAYVVEHLEAEPLHPGDCQEMVGRLKGLVEKGRAEFVSSYGWENADFQEPDCNGNLIRSGDRLAYVDIHNFALRNYDKTLREVALAASSASHFGGQSGVLGGKFLYQEVPGVKLPAKRSPSSRMRTYDKLLAEAGISLEGKVMFDIGCNLGLMGAEYLRRGAHWVHGWDMPYAIDGAYSTLMSIGCTRFSQTAGPFGPETRLFEQLPEHLKATRPEDGIVSYLAIRGHVNWLPGLRELPWRYMIYEGHQNDEELSVYLDQLQQLVPVRLVTSGSVSDALSASRDSAIIERLA